MVFILDDELTMMMPGEEDAGGFCGGNGEVNHALDPPPQ